MSQTAPEFHGWTSASLRAVLGNGVATAGEPLGEALDTQDVADAVVTAPFCVVGMEA